MDLISSADEKRGSMYSQQDLLAFSNIFSGAKEFYGTTVVGEIVDGKAQSTSTCIHETVSPAVFARHLDGVQGIGLSPIKADDTVEFGAIDIDEDKIDLGVIIRAIWDWDLPICPCYSKSRKLHLYFFFPMETPAKDAVELMRWWAWSFRLPKKVEVFPKQVERTVNNKAYSWINLPYFNANDEKNHRKLVGRNGELLGLAEFVERAQRCKWSVEEHRKKIDGMKYSKAPPCIWKGSLLRDVPRGMRNNWLFSAAVYLTLNDENISDSDLTQELLEINASLEDPLPEEEVRGTVAKSASKKSYYYMCDAFNGTGFCDRSACSKTKHGKDSIKTLKLEFGQMTQYLTDPPNYDWIINGKKFQFETEQELLGQQRFRQLSLRFLRKVPKPLADADWSRLVDKYAQDMQSIEMEGKGNDFSTGSRFYDLISKYFDGQRKAISIQQVGMGRVYEDKETEEYVFGAWNLVVYIKETHALKGITQNEIRNRMIDMGAYRAGSYWRVPISKVPKIEEEVKPIVEQEDLSNHEGESDDF